MLLRLIFIFIHLLLIVGCAPRCKEECPPHLISLNIIDRNGLTETITTKDRLEKYECVDFLSHQPYQKVLQAYSKDILGNSQSVITSYYPNGQVKQYLEAVNSRAYGSYKEWYEDGTLKVEASIIGGIADITPCAEKSWEFDCIAQAWNEEGCLITSISYEKGVLEGDSIYYHSNGSVWKRFPYHKDQLNGTAEYFLDNGQILQTVNFLNNMREGTALRFWTPDVIASDECFCRGLLMAGTYFDPCGKIIAEVRDGDGYRATFNKTGIYELQEFHKGVLQGEVRVFDENVSLVRSYIVDDDLKNGEEIEYFPSENIDEPKPHLMITWYKGRIQGYVKSWYENGYLESQKELVNNKLNGVSTAWYKDGSLMMVEEYDSDRLLKGEYYKKGEKIPLSEVIGGKGTATIFDGDGRYIRKISYLNGKPET
jgi:antitoxin component YwqK of YwqJK toxin-antitoxin module